jgi:hypothetical protein
VAWPIFPSYSSRVYTTLLAALPRLQLQKKKNQKRRGLGTIIVSIVSTTSIANVRTWGGTILHRLSTFSRFFLGLADLFEAEDEVPLVLVVSMALPSLCSRARVRPQVMGPLLGLLLPPLLASWVIHAQVSLSFNSSTSSFPFPPNANSPSWRHKSCWC